MPYIWKHLLGKNLSFTIIKTYKDISQQIQWEHITKQIFLTVTLVTCINSPFQSFCFCEFGQHFSQHALSLIKRHNPFIDRMVTFWKFQGKIPEGFHGIGFIITCYTSDLSRKKRISEHSNRDKNCDSCGLIFQFSSIIISFALLESMSNTKTILLA